MPNSRPCLCLSVGCRGLSIGLSAVDVDGRQPWFLTPVLPARRTGFISASCSSFLLTREGCCEGMEGKKPVERRLFFGDRRADVNQPLFYLDCVWQCISEIAVVTERLRVPFPPSSPQCLAGPPFHLVHLGQPHVVGMASLFSFVLFSFLQCWGSNPRPCAH